MDVFDREFLTIRCRLVDLAAALDRVDRAGSPVTDDPRLRQLQQAIGLLASPDGNRTERVQMAFSLPYCEDWQHQYGI
jgi:hypothetical protein